MSNDNQHHLDLRQAIIEGDRDRACAVLTGALAAGAEPMPLVDLMQGAMDRVGVLFENGAIFLPEMYAAAQTVSACSALLKPHFGSGAPASRGTVVLATVKADIHDIGKNLVRIVLESAGYEVLDLGVDVPSETIVSRASEVNADLIALSSLMTISMHEMERVIELLKEAGLRERTKTIVGGAPISQRFADRIGADGYGKNARDAVLLARRLLGGSEA